MKNDIYLILYDYYTNKKFKKYFNTEHDKDKFKIKLQHSKKLVVLIDSHENLFLD